MYNELIDFLPKAFYILNGVVVTLEYGLMSVCFGLTIGIFLAICKIMDIKILKFFAHGYTSVFRGTPLLIQLMIVYNLLPKIGINLNVFSAGILAFSCNSGAYISEIIRAGINSIDKGQIEAAKALGIPPVLRMKDIIMPQAFRTILPALVSELIDLIKESALISTIGGMDLMYRANIIAASTYDYFLPMLTAALAYYIMVLIISSFAAFLEKRLAL